MLPRAKEAAFFTSSELAAKAAMSASTRPSTDERSFLAPISPRQSSAKTRLGAGSFGSSCRTNAATMAARCAGCGAAVQQAATAWEMASNECFDSAQGEDVSASS
eukprot:227553-Pleurochrysis_carterae.AAC.2